MNNELISQYTIQFLLAVATPVEKHIRKNLLCEYLGVGSSYLIVHNQMMVSEELANKYLNTIRQLESGKPLAYILGKQYFWNNDFLVNEHTLIPRPDTEVLIETILNQNKNSLSKNLRILDLGTGSGCIAITLAKELKNSHVTAIDLSEQALLVAKQNADIIGVDNIEFCQGSWYSSLVEQNKKFDIIVSNPPYIDPADCHLEQLTHEPITALIADDKGMSDIHYIVKNAIDYLIPNGLLAIEHGYDQGQKVREVFESHGFDLISTVKDYGGNERVTHGRFK